MKLLLQDNGVYRAKKGQTLALIAKTFCCSVFLLVKENHLTQEVCEGEVLRIPEERGNLYVVRGGESKRLLCGSDEEFYAKNGTNCLYPAQTVLL